MHNISKLAVIFFLYAGTNNYFQTLNDSLTFADFCAVGDLMCHSVQYQYAKTQKDSFDFNPVFRYVKNIIKSADFSLGNLETVIAGREKKYSGYPLFNSPFEYLEAIKNAGFDLLFTSNNHCMDRGKSGLINTIEKIKELGLINSGTYKNQNERDSILIIDVRGIKAAVLSYTFSTNGIIVPDGGNYLVNVIDTNLIKSDTDRAKKLQPDLILVYFHFGEEYSRMPSAFQKEIVNKTIKYGAGIILGSHPHVIQKLEKFKCNYGKLDSGFAAYSLGNFLSNQRWRYSDAGIILRFTIEKNLNTRSIKISRFSYVPTWVYKGKINGRNEFVILPAGEEYFRQYDFLDNSSRLLFKQSILDTQELLSNISSSKLNFEFTDTPKTK